LPFEPYYQQLALFRAQLCLKEFLFAYDWFQYIFSLRKIIMVTFQIEIDMKLQNLCIIENGKAARTIICLLSIILKV